MDIENVCKQAYIRSVENEWKILIKEDLEESILKAKPLSIKDLIATVPWVLWAEIGGYEKVKL